MAVTPHLSHKSTHGTVALIPHCCNPCRAHESLGIDLGKEIILAASPIHPGED